jgi:putative ABC transport system permease protein
MKEAFMELGPILRALSRNKLRSGMLIVEIAVTVAIVSNCVAMILHARREIGRASGFDDDNLVWVFAQYFDPAFRDVDRLDGSLRADLASLSEMRGVRSVMVTSFVPWATNWSATVKPAGSSAEPLWTQSYAADDRLLDTLGVELDEGRSFTRDDVERETQLSRGLQAAQRKGGSHAKRSEPHVVDVIISRALAQRVFEEGPYLGKVLEDDSGRHCRVIGVLGRFYNPHIWPIHELAMFSPEYSHSYEHGSLFLVRTEPGRAEAVAGILEERLRRPGERRTVRVGPTIRDRDRHHAPPRMMAALMGLLAILMLFVTSLGIAGLTSFAVTERTRQIGTRRALGATTADILRHFLTEAWLLTTTGLVLGVGLAVGLNMILVTVYSEAKLGAGTLVVSALVLWMVGLGAALPPALRGARTSPAIATRNV